MEFEPMNNRSAIHAAEDATNGDATTYGVDLSSLAKNLVSILEEHAEVAELILAWSELPDAVRSGMLAVVRPDKAKQSNDA